jgi:hypothetical protein
VVAGFGQVGLAMAAQIWRDDEEILGECGDVALEDGAGAGEAVELDWCELGG